MIAGSLQTFLSLQVVAFSSTILAIVGPTNAFVTDVRLLTRNSSGRQIANPIALAAGGFGKAPTGKSTSKKKKNTKTKRKKNPAKPELTYISYDSNDGGSEESQQATRALMEWLDEEEVEGLDSVEIGVSKPDGPSPGLRGVFAKHDIMPGEYIMAVPYVTTLLVDEDFDPTSDPGEVLLRADEPEVGFKFWEGFFCNNDNKQKYKSFLDCLPMSPEDPNFDGTPDFWSEEDIRQLEIPGVVDKMLTRKEAIEGFVDRISDSIPTSDGTDNGDKTAALATIQQCCWLVQSRAFTTYKKAIDLDGNVGLLSRVVLIPFIDMINHASRKHANAEMQVVETKEYDESFYALVATKPIRKGTEIKICYGTGEETSLEIFSKYGFWPEVEDRQKEKESLQKLLENVKWSTTFEEDKAMLETEEGNPNPKEPMKTILTIRIYAKSLLL